jgi:hypothetical protein
VTVASVPDVTPDFVIVGNQKSGTTALFTYLGEHPTVAVSRRKEPCFWSSDVRRKGQVTDRAAYLALWDDAPRGALRGEASTDYIRSEVAVPAIRRENPQARFIVMLRNPVDMAPALHSEFLNHFQEDVGDFERAWRLQERRRRGEAIPPECVDVDSLQYERMCAIGTNLERFFAMVPESHRMSVVFDDLERESGSVYRQVLDFLGAEDDGRSRFDVVHANRNLRSPSLARVHRSMPRRLGPLYPPARAAARAVGLSPSRLVNRLNVRPGPRRPLRPEFRAELAETFEPEVAKVAALLGRDLSHWR